MKFISLRSFTRFPPLSSLLAWFGIAFILHLAWENAQAPFYIGFESFAQHFWMCLYATVTGDMIFMGVIYIALASSFADTDWLRRPGLLRHPATWTLPLIVGILLATCYELWAIHVEERWIYGELMPTVPVLHVGLLPLIQMIVIPSATVVVSYWLLGRRV